MATLEFSNVYLDNSAIVGCKMEKEGPLAKYFDILYNDLYCGERTFEKAEQHLVKDAFKEVFKKSEFKQRDIDIMFGGDLLNQITTSPKNTKRLLPLAVPPASLKSGWRGCYMLVAVYNTLNLTGACLLYEFRIRQ